MVELYYYPGNANLAPHMVLEEIGQPFRLTLIDRTVAAHKSPAYLKLNPRGLIPVLVDGDLALYETAAIMLYLADKHPQAKLAPLCDAPERAKFYQWLFLLANSIHPEAVPYFYPERCTTDPKGIDGVKASAEARLGQMFDFVDAHLARQGPYMLGETFSLLDLYLWMLSRWGRGMAHPPRDRVHIRRLLETLSARPAVQRALASEGLKAPLY